MSLETMAYVTVDGIPMSGFFYERLMSITVQDGEGLESDSVKLELEDGDYGIALPRTGALIAVALGLAGTPLVHMGLYTAQGPSGGGPVRTMTITGKAFDMTSQVRSPRAKGREGKTLGEIAGEVAGEAGLQPVVGPSVADIPFSFVAQQGESDLHMLARLCRPLDVTVKATDGKLAVVKRGEGLDASGEPIIPQIIRPSMLTEWQWSLNEREETGEVTAEWRDQPGAQTRKAFAAGGDGPPKHLRRTWGSEQEAQLAARGEADRAKRASGSFSGSGKFMPYLFGGGRALTVGFKPGLPLLWHVGSATHTLEAGGYLGTDVSMSLSGSDEEGDESQGQEATGA